MPRGTQRNTVYRIEGAALTLFDPAQERNFAIGFRELASFTGGKNRLSDVTDVYLKKLAQWPTLPAKPNIALSEAGVFYIGLPPETVHKTRQANKHVLILRQYSFVALFQFLFNVITYSHSFSFYNVVQKITTWHCHCYKKNKVAQPGNILKPVSLSGDTTMSRLDNCLYRHRWRQTAH